MDLPSFFGSYPFDDSAGNPIDGGVGVEVRDHNGVAICDSLLLRVRRRDVASGGWR